MTGLRPICRLLESAWIRAELRWLRWARSEMRPLHPDMPWVVRRIRTLEDRCG